MKLWLLNRYSIISMFFQVLQSDLIVKPQNTVVVSGNPTTLNCSSSIASSSIFWLLSSVRIVQNCVVNPNYTSHYDVVNSSNNRCDLVVRSVSETQCGTYTCQDTSLDFATAVLTQVVSNPNCQLSNTGYITEGQVVTMTCSVDYYNVIPYDMTPNMMWSADCEPSTQSDFGSSVSSSVNVTVQLPTLSTCSCSTTFKAPTLPIGSAGSANAPAYSYLWTSPPDIQVSYCPTNVSISPPGGNVSQWTEFSCSYDAYPLNAEFEWSVDTEEGTRVFNGTRSFTLTTVGHYNLTCTPTNYLLGGKTQPCRNQNVTVRGSSFNATEPQTTTDPAIIDNTSTTPTLPSTDYTTRGPSSDLSDGEKAAIIVTCCIVFIAIIILPIFLYKKNLVCFKPTNQEPLSRNQVIDQPITPTSNLSNQDDFQNGTARSQTKHSTEMQQNTVQLQNIPDDFHPSQPGPQSPTDPEKVVVYAVLPDATVPMNPRDRRPVAYNTDPSNVYGQVNIA